MREWKVWSNGRNDDASEIISLSLSVQGEKKREKSLFGGSLVVKGTEKRGVSVRIWMKRTG